MSHIAILKHFTFAAASGQTFTSDWIRLPEGYQLWQLVVLIHCRISTSAGTLQGETSWDTGVPSLVGSTANLATLGNTPVNITTGMGLMFRVVLAASGGADSVVTLSVYLTPKTN